ncbi:MAG TPA: AAA family ATPase [Spirochaetia bacterium]|nr:AAA family ATPase [Spirochaetia bacterium]
MSKPRLRMRLLGGFAVWIGEREIPEAAFGRRKARSLLKLLALQPGYKLHRDQVMELLWPGLGGSAAAAQLYKTIHHVRQAFGDAEPEVSPESLLQLRDEVVSLAAPGGVHTDIDVFERLGREARRLWSVGMLQRAISSCGGDLLPADLYEDWTAQRRDSLRQLSMELLLELGEAHLGAGQLAEAADAFRQALVRDEATEAAHRGLMRVYAAQGNRTRALRQFQRCAEALERELDVAPDEETARLHRQIASGEGIPVRRARAVPVPEPGLPGPLAGREGETREIAGLLIRLSRGEGAALGIEGTAGIGKTRMAQQIVQLARQAGCRVLFGAAHQEEGRSAYAPFVEALRMALRSESGHVDLIPAELAVSIPEIAPSAPPAPAADRRAAQAELFAGVLRFLTAEGRTAPVVLILDDLHIADEGSFQLYHYLARQASQLPLLLVGTWRGEPDIPPALVSAAASLQRQDVLHRLVLTPLSELESRDLLQQALGPGEVDAGLAREVHRLSGGNPLLASEAIRQMISSDRVALVRAKWRKTGREPLPIPPSLHTFVAERLARLSPAAAHLVNLAAVIGHDIPFPVLELSFEPPPKVDLPSTAPLLDLLDEALAARLLEERGLSYGFPHPLFRDVLYGQMSEARRKDLHGLIARTLETLHKDDPAIPVEAIADHALRAGDTVRALAYLMEAGDRAEAVYDHAEALRRFGEALSLLGGPLSAELRQRRAEVEERIGDAHRAIGELVPGLAAYRQALATLSEAHASPAREAQATLHRKIATSAILTIDMVTAAEHLARAREMTAPGSLDEARLLVAEALYDWHRNELTGAVEHASRALEIAEAAEAPVEVSQACEMLALSYLPLGEWEQGMKYELRRNVTGWSPEVAVAIDGHLCLWEYHMGGEEPYRQAEEFITAVVKQAATVGDLRCVAVCHYALGSMDFFRGRLRQADEHLTRALALHGRIGSPAGAAYTLARKISLRTASGDQNSGWAFLQQGVEAAEQAVVRDHCLQRLYGAGIRNRLEAGDMANAAELVRQAEESETRNGVCPSCSAELFPAVASFHLASKDIRRAEQYAEKARALAEAGHNESGEAESLRVQGEVQAAKGDLLRAEQCFQQAATMFRRLGRPYDLGMTLRAWGRLPLTGDPDHLKPIRREAREILKVLRTS